MSATTSRPTALRNVGAVFAGLLTVVVPSTLTDLVMHGTGIFPPEGQPMATALWVLASAYRFVYGVAGGYVVARLAPARPMPLVLVLGGIGTLASVLGVVATWGKGPEFGPMWFPLSLVVTALPSVWLGGRLHTSRPTA